jgi:hypothetical protein
MITGDEEKTSFITPFGTYCFNRMPFGLKNDGATFARLIYKILDEQLGRNVVAYVDDIVVKSDKKQTHLQDLSETFGNLREAGLKLNPDKCVLGMRAGKMLGFLISQRGIEADPEKIKAIMNVQPPKSVKEVQRFMGRIGALNRFISKLAEKSEPIIRAMRSSQKFHWGEEQNEAFLKLK